MNTKTKRAFKAAAVVLIGICVVILFSVNKYTSSIVLAAAAAVILLPSGKSGLPKWGRRVFLLLAFAFLIMEHFNNRAAERTYRDRLLVL